MLDYKSYDTISDEMLDLWIRLKKNVIFLGDHGVGKTSIVKSAWEAKGLKYAIFSGSTLDPWVDLIGVPKLVNVNGKDTLKLIQPENINDDIEAIFIDEYNRSHAKVRNAVLELQQFKTINGRHFPNLKFVWAAANPPDTENNYDVEEIDPAQLDRFQIIVKLANKINKKYFTEKYGPKIAKAADKWFADLGEQKSQVSPRRLDYAIEYLLEGGDIRECIPDLKINITTLIKGLKGSDDFEEFKKAVLEGNEVKVSKMVNDQKKFQAILPESYGDAKCCEAIVRHAEPEILMSLAEGNENFAYFVARASVKDKNIVTAIEDAEAATGRQPNWYRGAVERGIAARSALDTFIKIIASKTERQEAIEIGNISSKISSHPVSEIIDDIGIQKNTIYKIEEGSAANYLNFVNVVCKNGYTSFASDINFDQEVLGEFAAVFLSSLNFYYLRDANLDAVAFSFPKSIEILKCFSDSPVKKNGRTGGMKEEEL